MAIDWERLLTHNGIEFVTSGNNVRRGELNIKCPFCADDPSQHMGIDPHTGFWSCWRDRAHSGKRPHRLVMRLTKLSYEAVERLIAETPPLPDGFREFVEQNTAQRGVQQDAPVVSATFHGGLRGDLGQPTIGHLSMPDDFLPLHNASDAEAYFRYLRARGLGQKVCKYFSLHWCPKWNSTWNERVIIPYFEQGQLVTWIGRSILSNPPGGRRYMAFADGLSSTAAVYNIDNVRREGPRTLVITEGPFDAINVHYCGKDNGIGAVALSTVSASERQLALLALLTVEQSFDNILVALDYDVTVTADRLVRELSPFGRVRRCAIPSGYKDPAELPRKEVLRMCQT